MPIINIASPAPEASNSDAGIRECYNCHEDIKPCPEIQNGGECTSPFNGWVHVITSSHNCEWPKMGKSND